MLGVDLYYTAELRPARIGTWPFGIIGDSGPISGSRMPAIDSKNQQKFRTVM